MAYWARMIGDSHCGVWKVGHDNGLTIVWGIGMKVKMDENGKVAVPAEYRRKAGIYPGDSVELKVESDGLRLSATKNRTYDDKEKIGPATEFIQGKSLSEALILERRERAARYLSMEARRKGDIAEARLLEKYERLARRLGECATHGTPVSEDMIQERREMEAYLWEKAGGSG